MKLRNYITLVLAFCVSAAVLAGEAGEVKSVSGTVQVERNGALVAVSPGMKLMSQDVLITGKDGQVAALLLDDTRLSMDANSRVELASFSFNPVTTKGEMTTKLHRGILSVVSGKLVKSSPGMVRYTTPSSVLAVRGTEFVMEVNP